MYYDPQKVIGIALDEIGYLEKATNENLDDKTANAGDKNYTKYARDLWKVKFFNSSKVGVAWCAVFVGWCFNEAFGKTTALKLLCQPSSNNCGAGCGSARNYFKNKNQLVTENPHPGDVIYFYSKDKSEVSHTGIVYSTDKTYVYTIEGNTSSESGVVANGGAVAKKRYKLNYERIAGYGRPDWGEKEETTEDDVQEDTTAKDETVSKNETSEKETDAAEEVTVLANGLGSRTLENGSKGDDVKALQELLNDFDYITTKLDTDGRYGYVTAKAVRAFQKERGIQVDGKYGKQTHQEMVKAVAEMNVSNGESAEEGTEDGMRQAVVHVTSGTTLNYRTAPDISARLVTGMPRIKNGETVSVKTTGEGWAAVEYKGYRGYVMAEYLVFEGQDAEEDKPVDEYDEKKTYTVQKGDTLWKIATKFLGGGKYYRKIMDANGMKNTIVKPGMVLKIPE